MDVGMLSLIGIFVGLVVLVWGAYKGLPILVLGPAAAVIVFAFSGLPIIENMKGAFAADFGGFATSNFLLRPGFPAPQRLRHQPPELYADDPQAGVLP